MAKKKRARKEVRKLTEVAKYVFLYNFTTKARTTIYFHSFSSTSAQASCPVMKMASKVKVTYDKRKIT